MTDKQERFCLEYLIDLNATQAAIRAGYSEETAGSIGGENLKKPEIQKRIEDLKREQSERLQISSDMIAKEFAKIAFSRPHDAFKIKGGAIVFEKWEDIPEDLKDCIQEVTPTKEGIKIKFYDKQRALENLGKHLGFYEEHNNQKRGIGEAQAEFDSIMAEVNARSKDQGGEG